MIERKQPAADSRIISIADQVRSLCSVITKIARADLQSRLESHNFGISSIEHGVLRHLSHDVTSMAEISRLMGVAPSTLVYVVDGLVERKLVRRGKDPRDRRREPLLLEKKGADLFTTIPTMDKDSVLVKSLESMTESRRLKFLSLLSEFAEGLPGSGRSYLGSEPLHLHAARSASSRNQTSPLTKTRKAKS